MSETQVSFPSSSFASTIVVSALVGFAPSASEGDVIRAEQDSYVKTQAIAEPSWSDISEKQMSFPNNHLAKNKITEFFESFARDQVPLDRDIALVVEEAAWDMFEAG